MGEATRIQKLFSTGLLAVLSALFYTSFVRTEYAREVIEFRNAHHIHWITEDQEATGESLAPTDPVEPIHDLARIDLEPWG